MMSTPFIKDCIARILKENSMHQLWDSNLNRACRDLQNIPVRLSPPILNSSQSTSIQNPSYLNVFPSNDDSKDSSKRAEQINNSIQRITNYGVFEIRGNRTLSIFSGYYASKPDLSIINSALQNYYPNCVTEIAQTKTTNLISSNKKYFVYDFITDAPFYKNFTSFHDFTISPLNLIVRLLYKLECDDEGVFQVLFTPLPSEVGRMVREAIDIEWRALQGPDNRITPSLQSSAMNEKLEYKTPELKSYYFAVSARIILPCDSLDSEVKAFIANYTYGGRLLRILDNQFYSQEQIKEMLINRTVYHSGMILNAHELTALHHLPYQTLVDKTLKEVFAHAPCGDVPVKAAQPNDVSIGHWACGNSTKLVHLPIQKEIPHVHVLGLSRMGKTQLLTHIALESFLK